MNSSRPCDGFSAKILLTVSSSIYLLVLPVYFVVARVGYKKWKKHKSVSHTDVFTFHMVALELKRIVASCLFCYTLYSDHKYLQDVGSFLISISLSGQLLFHCLTCGERYLAAVHPITYIRLKKRGGVTIRNVSIALTWLWSFAQILVRSTLYYTVLSCVSCFCALVVVTFCSVSVLRVLIGPRPGGRGGDGRRIDQSKRSACSTMLAILGALSMRFTVLLMNYTLTLSRLEKVDICVMRSMIPFFEFPSCLVLPLLFLHREGKLRV